MRPPDHRWSTGLGTGKRQVDLTRFPSKPFAKIDRFEHLRMRPTAQRSEGPAIDNPPPGPSARHAPKEALIAGQTCLPYGIASAANPPGRRRAAPAPGSARG
jgi:hypothetical protein